MQERISNYKKAIQFSDVPSEYTLFNDILYIGSADYNEIENFLDNIVIKPSPLSQAEFDSIYSWQPSFLEREYSLERNTPPYTKMGKAQKRQYDMFKKYVCFACKGSFFDAKKIIKDRIGYDLREPESMTFPILDITLNQREKYQARLQTFLLREYQNNIKSNSDPYENEYIRTNLYQFLFHFSLLNKKAGDYFQIVDHNNEKQIQFNNSDSIKLDLRNISSMTRMIKDMESESLIERKGDQYFPIIDNMIV